jgi:hypothetical protein
MAQSLLWVLPLLFCGAIAIENFRVRIDDPVSHGQMLVARGGQFVNFAPTDAALGPFGNEVQYVEQGGSDGNTGFSRQQAKRSVGGALMALTGTSHTGRIYVGSGVFVERPMTIKQNVRISGNGPQGAASFSGGTTLSLAAGSNAPLFSAPDSPLAEYWHHYLLLRDMTLNGNSDSQTVAGDILHIAGGGFNTTLENLHFEKAGRWGIKVMRKAVNLHVSNCTGSWLGSAPATVEAYDPEVNGGFCFLDFAAGPGGHDLVVMDSLQLDNCGTFPIFVRHLKAHGGFLKILGIKMEAQMARQNVAAVGYAGGDSANDRLNISVECGLNDNTVNSSAVNLGFFHQVSGLTPAHVRLEDCRSLGTPTLYSNAVTGQSYTVGNTVAALALYDNRGAVSVSDLRMTGAPYATEGDAGIAALPAGTVYGVRVGAVVEARIKE